MTQSRRYELARGLLGSRPEIDIMERIKNMPVADRQRLQGLVDWVEDYERKEMELAWSRSRGGRQLP